MRSPPPGIAVDPFFVVFACIGLDDTECALAELEKALRQRSSNLIFLRIAPGLDPLRDNARFKAIIDQMNFPDDTA